MWSCCRKQILDNQADACRRKTTSAFIYGLIVDALLAYGFLSYAGPFNQEYRNQLLTAWRSLLKQTNVACTWDINIVTMLIATVDMPEWSLQGLPNDELSLQNVSIAKKGRSPLLVDQQGYGGYGQSSLEELHLKNDVFVDKKRCRKHNRDLRYICKISVLN